MDLWTFFQAAGGVAALGYPVSSQWSKGPFTLQTFQKAAIQWSESGGFQYVNIYDKLPAVDRQARFEDAATTFDRLAGLIRGRVPPAALAELPPSFRSAPRALII